MNANPKNAPLSFPLIEINGKAKNAEDARCVNCQHWQPRYYGVGTCTATNMPNAKLWVTGKEELLTRDCFSCSSFLAKENPKEQML